MKSHKRLNKGVLIFFIFLIFLAGCHFFVDPSFRQQYTDYNSFVHSNPEEPGYLKVHYKDGQVVVYNTWDLSEEKDSLTGEGKLFDLRREMIMEGPLATAMDQVAIIETNQLEALKDKIVCCRIIDFSRNRCCDWSSLYSDAQSMFWFVPHFLSR